MFNIVPFSLAEEEIISSVPVSEMGIENTSTNDVPSEPQTGMSHEVRLMHLAIQEPEKVPTVLENGRIVVSTVESYDVAARGISPCSFTARHNIVSLLNAMNIPIPWMAQGDASDLIRFGRINNTLTSFTDKTALIEALNQRKDEHVETVFDVYRFVVRRSPALQAHRVAVFL
ncbi:hypothetical protein H6768_05315 [Candidatus Peribacteria bacterium]|nr:hypothetical protein [Candidatus Peribacteria bacterium]